MNARGRRAALVAAAVLLVVPAGAAARPRPCAHEQGFVCDSVTVPLDRTGRLPGTLQVHFAAQDRLRHAKVLIALTGGPGQNGIPFGPAFASDLAPALRDHRLVVLDQRGTGRSSALNCPELQTLNTVQPILPEDVAGCARRLGPQRDSYASIDTADDIEAIRRALGVPRISLYGVSYGTWVEQQYARAYPDHVERLVLDSVVPPGNDPWDLRVTEAIPRVLRGFCARGGCAGITRDPFADLAAVVQRIQAQGRLRGNVIDQEGGRRRTVFSEFDLLETLVASDLNPWIGVRLPGALVAARNGDDVPLLRLRRDVAGPPPGLRDLSGGLFAATTCVDQPLPYSYGDPPEVRAAAEQAALNALAPETFAPFDRATIDLSSAPQICLQWPSANARPEATGPMPDVPTLVLSGLSDLRTPLEGARALAATIPHAEIVTVPGAGHSVLGSDATGCVRRAIERFFAPRPVGNPCAGVSDQLPLAAVPPRSLAQVQGTAGVPGLRGRVLRAAVATVGDARTTDNESLYAGYNDSAGGGLRGGSFGIIPTSSGDLLLLRGMVYVPGVTVDGAVISAQGRFTGRLLVHAPHGLSGTLSLRGGEVTGRLGGRRVRARARSLARARLARAAALGVGYDRWRMGLRQPHSRRLPFAGDYAYAYAWRFR